ncbi:Kinesin-like protein kif21b [Mortierella sp. AM989]|nr:Kinesin-like protein kif21b [Mortierella sp. AM989]
MNTAVKVALRVRPLTLQEQINNCSECISYVPNEPQIGIVGSEKSFTFDYVFDEETAQRQVYEQCAKELVDRFVEGFNVTILAYGQTGSGKTYSMGTGLQYQNADQAIVPRAAQAIFSMLDAQMEKDSAMEYQVYVSFLELYNEELIDLLQTQPRTRKDTIQVREDGFGGISWQGVKEQQVNSAQELLDWLQKGSLCRTTAATDMNQTSSRSHAIFSVILKQQRSEEIEELDGNNEQVSPSVAPTTTKSTNEKSLKKLASKFHFVDLAGSERLKRTRAVGDRAKEGISINSGLLALGNVISALGDESRKSSHIPYRDSKLTRLLQDSLGGNSATLMLACVSGADVDINETISTLVYANRARNIRNRVVINQDFRDSNNAEIAQLRAEINRLRMENSAFKAMGSGPAAELDQRRAAEEMRSLRGEVTRLRDRLKESSSELCDVLAERDTLLVEREVQGDNIEAHPIMMTYHHTVMQLKDRLIAAEDQALELQTLLSQKPSAVFGRRPQASNSRQKAPSPFKKRIEPLSDDDHDADGEHEEGQGRKESSPPRGRQSKRRSRQSSRAVSRFDFGATAAALGMEPAKLPASPPVPEVEQLNSSGGASSWFQNLKTEESQPLSAHLDYSSTSSSSMLQRLTVDSLTVDSDSSHDFSRRRRAARNGSGGVVESFDKAKEDIRRGLLLLNAEKNGMGMDMDLLNMLTDPSAPARPSPASSRRRSSMTSSMSSGSSNRSRFQSQIPPTLEDVINSGSPISPMRASFPFPLPPGVASWKETPSVASWKETPSVASWKETSSVTSWKESSASPQDSKVFFEAEQKAAETLANAMKAMHRFSFPLSMSDTQQISQQQQQTRLAMAIQQQKASGVALPDSDASSIHTGSIYERASARTSGSVRGLSHVASEHNTHKSSEKNAYGERFNEVQSGLAIKEELVHQLERVEADYHNMRSQYEEEIRVMEDRIRETEMDRERDRANENKASRVSQGSIHIPGSVKVKYEAKIKQLMSELSDLQHKYSDVSKIANEKRTLAENQLRTLRVSVETLKAEKQRMIKRMKEDAERIKEMNAANDREIQALRRAEKTAVEGRKKAEREIELQLQQQRAMLHRNNAPATNAPSKVVSFLKKPQTPKGITKSPKRAPRLGPSERNDTKGSSIPAPKSARNQSSIRLQVAQKKQVIDRAIYGYISGQHAINLMEDLLKKRQRLRSEKQELEQERVRVVEAQEESAIANGTIMLDFASEPQYMDDRLAMIDAEVAYVNARIRALQAEAAALGFVTALEKNYEVDGKDDEEEMMTKLIRQGMADDAMGLPPGSGAAVAFESSISILRSLDLNEAKEFLEMLFEDMVSVRANENTLLVQVKNQEKVIEELKRALLAMRQAAVGATLGYEKRCDGLEQKLRQLGGSSEDIAFAARPQADNSSEEDENDAEVARLIRNVFKDGEMTSPALSRAESKDTPWTPLPSNALPRSGSAAEAILDVKSKRTSTIFDQMYEEAIKTSDEASPKVGGTGGEFSRILMANSDRRVSWAGVPPSDGEDSVPQEQEPQPQPQPQAQPQRPRLGRSVSANAINQKATADRPEIKERGNTSMYGHRRGGSTSSGGSGGAHGLGIAHNAAVARSESQSLQRGAFASTASSRQHAEAAAARRSSTPVQSPAIGPKSTARPRYNSNAEGPTPSPSPHPKHGGAPLTIQTGFSNGHAPQHTLRHAKSHQQPLNLQRLSHDSRRASTPSPGLLSRRLARSDSDGAGLAGQSAAVTARVQNGNARPLSRIGSASMMTTTPTATNIVNGLVSPGLHAFNTDAGSSEHYHTHHNNGSSRRVSGSWDDNQNVYERLASVHTQASQARIAATRTNTYPPQTSTPAGGSMMTSGNNVSIGFQQIQQNQHLLTKNNMRRPSVDITAEAQDEVGDLNGQGERNWSSNSTSSVTSSVDESSHAMISETTFPKSEVGPVF